MKRVAVVAGGVAALAILAVVGVVWSVRAAPPPMPPLPDVQLAPVVATCPAPGGDCYLTPDERAEFRTSVDVYRGSAYRAFRRVAERRRAQLWSRSRAIASAAIAALEIAALLSERSTLDDTGLIAAEGRYMAVDEDTLRARFDALP